MSKDNLWTVRECAEFLRVKPDWVYSAIQKHGLPCMKIGRLYRFDPEEVRKWLMEYRQ